MNNASSVRVVVSLLVRQVFIGGQCIIVGSPEVHQVLSGCMVALFVYKGSFLGCPYTHSYPECYDSGTNSAPLVNTSLNERRSLMSKHFDVEE